MSEGFSQRLREGVFILSSALSIFLLIALVTFHNSDPSWSQSGWTDHVSNAGGIVGAWFSDIFLYFFGYIAYIFPVGVAYGAWSYMRRQRDTAEDTAHDYWLLGLRILGFILIVLAADGLVSLHGFANNGYLPFDSGGITGDVVQQGLVATFNVFGSSVVLLALLLAGITLFTGLSWLSLLELTGKLSQKLGLKFWRYSRRLWQKSSENRAERKALREEQNQVAGNELHISVPTADEKLRVTKQQMQAAKPVVHMPIAKPKPQLQDLAPKKPAMKSAPATIKPIKPGEIPSLSILDQPVKINTKQFSREKLEQLSCEVEARLKDFRIDAKVVAVHPGPVITRFELQPAPGVKVSKISALSKDLARSLSTVSVRIVEVIPGKSVIGLEIPNDDRESVCLYEVLHSEQFAAAKSSLSLGLGNDIGGHPVVVDLAKMPHLLVAGTTGSGKSVGVNAMLLSLLFKATPEDVRLIMIDPKMLELSIYEGIPHLLAPVVTDMKEAASALRWCVAEMDRRYRVMAAVGVRNLAGYNKKVKDAIAAGQPLKDPLIKPEPGEDAPELTTLPFIVVVVDEFADMIMVVGKKVEELIARIAQKARAAGIHMILATQRPSVDVITGLIKSNIPTRISFQVSSRIDSRTVLDQQGAEQLLGQGDMLYLPPGTGVPVRVHGAFVADHEVHNVVDAWKQSSEPNYLEEILNCESPVSGIDSGGAEGEGGEQDALYDQAVRIVTESNRASISLVQRRLKVGYNRAARMIEEMEAAGIVSSMENGSREVLVAPPPPID